MANVTKGRDPMAIKNPLEGNRLRAQSGDPTAVVNQSLVGAILGARTDPKIKKFTAHDRCMTFSVVMGRFQKLESSSVFWQSKSSRNTDTKPNKGRA